MAENTFWLADFTWVTFQDRADTNVDVAPGLNVASQV